MKCWKKEIIRERWSRMMKRVDFSLLIIEIFHYSLSFKGGTHV
jgi:hypothetical protein